MNKAIFALAKGFINLSVLLLTNLIHIRRKWVICWLLSLVCMFNALQKLAALPTDSPEDAAFKNLYYQLLSGIAPPAGSGKAMSAQEQLLRSTAKPSELSLQSALAQSIMATYYYQTFDQNVPNIALPKELFNTPQLFKLHPNPSSNEVTITTNEQIVLPATLVIRDIYGKIVKNAIIDGATTTININYLPNGIYLCEITQKNTIKAVQKLTIIH